MNIGRYVEMYSEDLKLKNYSSNTIENYKSQVAAFLKYFNNVATKPSEISEKQSETSSQGEKEETEPDWEFGQDYKQEIETTNDDSIGSYIYSSKLQKIHIWSQDKLKMTRNKRLQSLSQRLAKLTGLLT